jgi:hypothetical protein
LLPFDQPLRAKPLFKTFKLSLKSRPEDFEIPMPTPEIPNPVLRALRGFAQQLGLQITVSATQYPRPDTVLTEGCFKICPPAVRNPKSPIDHELRGVQSLRRTLHLGDDFLRDGSRSLLIARKVHRVLRPALRARTHVGRITKHFSQGHDGLDHL